MKLSRHRGLLWLESILITLPMFGVVCWFAALGIAFGTTLVATTSVTIGTVFIVVAIIGFVGLVAFTHLSFLYLSRGLEVLQRSSRLLWIATALGAMFAWLGLLAILLKTIILWINFKPIDLFNDVTAGFIFAAIGAPLLIPYFHLRYLRTVNRADEANI